MKKKFAIVLAVIMVGCHMNALAESDAADNYAIEETSGASVEAEYPIETWDAVPLEESSDEKQKDDEGSPGESLLETDMTEPSESRDNEGSLGESLPETDMKESSECREESAAGEQTIESEERLPEEERIEKPSQEDVLEGTEGQQEENTEALPASLGEISRGKELDEQQLRQSDDGVYKVLIPAVTRAYLDPDNLSGRGQIFSDRYEVENYGNTDVAIKIKDIQIRCESDAGMTEDVIEKMNVDIVWENENDQRMLHVEEGSPDEYVMWLKAATYDGDGGLESLDDGSAGWFYFTGTMDAESYIDWESQEITVVFSYEIVKPDVVETHGEMREASRRGEDEADIQEAQPEVQIEETAKTAVTKPEIAEGESDKATEETDLETKSSPSEESAAESEAAVGQETQGGEEPLSG